MGRTAQLADQFAARNVKPIGLSTDGVEEHMACGIGVCWTCVMPIRGRDGQVRMKRSCIDGPVFSGRSIDWAATRYVASRDEPEPAPAEGAEELA